MVMSSPTPEPPPASTQTPDAPRAKLSFLIHFLGDVHQPLHCATRFTADDFPKGDRGGNDFMIKLSGHSSAVALHTFWDDLLGRPHAHANPDPELINMHMKEILIVLAIVLVMGAAEAMFPLVKSAIKLRKQRKLLNEALSNLATALGLKMTECTQQVVHRSSSALVAYS